MEDVSDDILTEKILRDLTRTQSELLSHIFITIPGPDPLNLKFQRPHLVQYLISESVRFPSNRVTTIAGSRAFNAFIDINALLS